MTANDETMTISADEEGGPPERTPVASGRERRALTRTDRVRDFLDRYGLIVALFVFFAVFSLLVPSKFPTRANVESMINSQGLILILGLAVTIVLRSGGFDLSIAAVMTVMGALASVMTQHGTSLLLVFGVALVIGVVVGAINGVLVVRVGVDSFVATLGMMTLLSGVAYAITNSRVVFNIDGPILGVARHDVFGLPALTWYGWILAVVLWYVYERTPVGRYILFVGGSPESARLAGLPVDRIRIMSFVTASVLSSLAGVLLAGFLGGIDPSVANGYLLPPFVGAFLGATTISVGRFNALGTIVGLYVLAIAVTGLQLLGAQPWVTNVFQGGALMIAVTLARLVARKSS
jgi:ribose transport system permease protein